MVCIVSISLIITYQIEDTKSAFKLSVCPELKPCRCDACVVKAAYSFTTLQRGASKVSAWCIHYCMHTLDKSSIWRCSNNLHLLKFVAFNFFLPQTIIIFILYRQSCIHFMAAMSKLSSILFISLSPCYIYTHQLFFFSRSSITCKLLFTLA